MDRKVALRWSVGLVGVIVTLVSQAAMAQWAWKDDQGHPVYSDQPPPSGIAKARILHTPSDGRAAPVPAENAAPAPADGGAATDGKPKTLAEQNLEFNKRLKDNAEAAKKASDLQAANDAKAQRCADAKTSLATLQSGQRVASTDAQGNKVYLDDSERQSQAARIQGSLSGC